MLLSQHDGVHGTSLPIRLKKGQLPTCLSCGPLPTSLADRFNVVGVVGWGSLVFWAAWTYSAWWGWVDLSCCLASIDRWIGCGEGAVNMARVQVGRWGQKKRVDDVSTCINTENMKSLIS